MPTLPPQYPPAQTTFPTRLPPRAAPPASFPTTQQAHPMRVAVRPTGVKVIGIIAVLHASLALIGFVVSAIMLLASGTPVDPTMIAIKSNGFLYTWALGSSAIGFALAMLLLFAALALMSMRAWARKAMLLWALAWMFLNVGGIVINIAYHYPLLEQNANIAPQTVMLAKVMGLGSSALLGIAWPIVAIAYLRRASVKQAFERAASGGVVL